jgi:hypothetical protein
MIEHALHIAACYCAHCLIRRAHRLWTRERPDRLHTLRRRRRPSNSADTTSATDR